MNDTNATIDLPKLTDAELRNWPCRMYGRTWCQFRADHKCPKCGRWERGFKPESEKRTHRHGDGECQVCANRQAMTVDGQLVHHGYERPGCGYIVGDCYGVGHAAFPASDALVLWAERLAEITVKLAHDVDVVTNAKTLIHRYATGHKYVGRRRVDTGFVEVVVDETEDGYRKVDASGFHRVPTLKALRENMLWKLHSEQEHVAAETKRVADRIALAKRTIAANNAAVAGVRS